MNVQSLNIDVEPLYKDYLRKKLRKNTWKEYWVVLREHSLLFFNSSDAKFAGSIELTHGTSCAVFGTQNKKPGFWSISPMDKSVNYNKGDSGLLTRILEKGCLKFALKTKRGIHLFKASSAESCCTWMRVLRHTIDEYGLVEPSAKITNRLALAHENISTLNLITPELHETESDNQIEPYKQFQRSKSMRENSKSSFKRGRFHSLRIKAQRKYSALQES
ncbi:uncharacterized protein LOC116617841 [Nematostella vectensis]|uniref:uncharacterized protein LOC116617841 n=1 Tax=Nematostella vectensis TaxID=45351 RepID=UPI00138FECE8|nr:uncharacterized protein LOC116617841 [Nematostella vectensis]